jgi:hypothetical protein
MGRAGRRECGMLLLWRGWRTVPCWGSSVLFFFLLPPARRRWCRFVCGMRERSRRGERGGMLLLALLRGTMIILLRPLFLPGWLSLQSPYMLGGRLSPGVFLLAKSPSCSAGVKRGACEP